MRAFYVKQCGSHDTNQPMGNKQQDNQSQHDTQTRVAHDMIT